LRSMCRFESSWCLWRPLSSGRLVELSEWLSRGYC
jgi:hypothetical protein